MSSEQRTFGGRYAAVRQIGAGGMSDVYLARDELLGREVAVKVLGHRFASDRSFVERFRREAQSAANLNHPNVVSLYDFGSDEGTYFIVMEYIDGRSLADVIKNEGPLLPERAAEITTDAAKALHRAHEAGLVHRDVKPSNIMLTSTGQTKVTDFGIARAINPDGAQTMTQTGMVIGTAAYLSPEQAQGEALDARSDIYSLGCVLYECLSGRPPFSGETPLAIAYKHVREDPPPPSSVNADVPASLDAIVMKAMAKNAENRYPSAEHMVGDLGRYLSGQRVEATPLMAAETSVAPRATGTQMMDEADLGPPSRRSTGFFVGITLLILALVGGLAWFVATNVLATRVEVPEVIGLSEADARVALREVGFEVEVLEEFNRKTPQGEVFLQDPEAGVDAREGSVITITVSSGVRQVEVPDLAGLTVEEATTELEDERLKLGDVLMEPSEDIEEGQVIRSIPAAGSEVDARSTVNLIVSSGPDVVIVPTVVGLTEEQAKANITNANLKVEVARAPSDRPEGEVFAQDPVGGTEAAPGDTVRISVSEGPEEKPMPDVKGMPYDDAKALLENDFGLIVTRQDPQGACAEPPGFVCGQDPGPGTPVKSGDPATLFVQPGQAALPGGGFGAAFAWLGGVAMLFGGAMNLA